MKRATTFSVAIAMAFLSCGAAASQPGWMAESVADLEDSLVATYGEQQRGRAAQGLSQAASFWRVDDGDREEFESFVRENFAGDQQPLDAMFTRYEKLLEQLDGHLTAQFTGLRPRATRFGAEQALTARV